MFEPTQILFIILFELFLVYTIYEILKSGWFRNRTGYRVDRKKQPLHFWLSLFVVSVIVLIFGFLLVIEFTSRIIL